MDTTNELLGDYELLCEIGRGAQARVYRARCHNSSRVDALKLFHTLNSADLTARSRFITEVLALSLSEHPNIAVAITKHIATISQRPQPRAQAVKRSAHLLLAAANMTANLSLEPLIWSKNDSHAMAGNKEAHFPCGHFSRV